MAPEWPQLSRLQQILVVGLLLLLCAQFFNFVCTCAQTGALALDQLP